MITLGKSKENCNCHVLQSRYQKFWIISRKTYFKPSDFQSVLVNEQTSKQYSKTGKHLRLTSCNTTSSADMRPTLAKIALAAR